MVRWRCIHTQQLYASGKYAIYLFICLLLLVRAGRCDKNDGIAILLYNTQYVFKYLYVSANRLVPKTSRKNNFLQTEKDKKKNFYSFEVWEQNQFVIAKFCIYVFLISRCFQKVCRDIFYHDISIISTYRHSARCIRTYLAAVRNFIRRRQYRYLFRLVF